MSSASASPQPGTVEYLHHFVQQCTPPGQISQLKGGREGITVISDLPTQRLPIMFRTTLPQNNGSRHALLLMRLDLNHVDRNELMQNIFQIYNNINGHKGMITGYRFMWANGVNSSTSSLTTFVENLRIMGNAMNGIVEVQTALLQCAFCEERDDAKLTQYWMPDTIMICPTCIEEYFDPVPT